MGNPSAEVEGRKREVIAETQIPRRARLDLNTPAEIAIREAMLAVEDVGAHPLLTEAADLLGKARNKVADYVDLKNSGGVSRLGAFLRELTALSQKHGYGINRTGEVYELDGPEDCERKYSCDNDSRLDFV